MSNFKETHHGNSKISIQTPQASLEQTRLGKVLSETFVARETELSSEFDWHRSCHADSSWSLQARHYQQQIDLQNYWCQKIENFDERIEVERAHYDFQVQQYHWVNQGEELMQAPHEIHIQSPLIHLTAKQAHYKSQRSSISAQHIQQNIGDFHSQFQQKTITAKRVEMPVTQQRIFLPPVSTQTTQINLLSFKHPLFDSKKLLLLVPRLPNNGVHQILRWFPKAQQAKVLDELYRLHYQENEQPSLTTIMQSNLKNLDFHQPKGVAGQLVQLRLWQLENHKR